MTSPASKHSGKILPATVTRQIYSSLVEYTDDGRLHFLPFFFFTVFGCAIIRPNHTSNNSCDNISYNCDNISILMTFSAFSVQYRLGGP